MTEWDTPHGLSNASICSQRPEAREVIYKLTANQQLGHFSPSEVLSEPPPMLATVFHARAMAGRECYIPNPVMAISGAAR